MRTPITRLLKIANKFERGELTFNQGDSTLCIIGQANKELFGRVINSGVEVFAQSFGLYYNTAYDIFMGNWRSVLGGNFINHRSLDLVTRRHAVRFIRALVKKIQSARQADRKINRAETISLRYGKVEVV